MKILLTAFDAFGGYEANAAQEAVRLVDVPASSGEVKKIIVPTVFERSMEVLKDAIEEHCPDVVLSVGQAAGRSAVTVERVAINLMDARIADNDGFQPVDMPIEKSGPAAYFSTVPVRRMVEAIQARGIPAEISNTAGTFVCNRLLYGALHYADVHALPLRVGFVHVPCILGQEEAVSQKLPTLELEQVIRALEEAVRVL